MTTKPTTKAASIMSFASDKVKVASDKVAELEQKLISSTTKEPQNPSEID